MSALRYAGYGAFFLLSLLIGLYLTFPWDVVKDRILARASKESGLAITATSLEPSWLTGFEAKDVKVITVGKPDTPIRVDSLLVRLKLVPLLFGDAGLTLEAPIARGQIYADVTIEDDKVGLEAQVKEVQLELLPALTAAMDLPLSGKLTLNTALVLGKKDQKLTNGTIGIKTGALKIEKGGKIGLFPLPPLELGNLALEIPVKQGKAEFKTIKLSGTDLEISLDGMLSFAFPISKGTVALNVGLKPTAKLLASDPLLKPILSNFNQYVSADGFYGVSISGVLQHPRIKAQKIHTP